MRLIAFYVVFVLIGDLGAYVVGRTVEQWSAAAGLSGLLFPGILARLATRRAGDRTQNGLRRRAGQHRAYPISAKMPKPRPVLTTASSAWN